MYSEAKRVHDFKDTVYSDLRYDISSLMLMFHFSSTRDYHVMHRLIMNL